MLFLPSKVSRYFKENFEKRPVAIITDSGDLYRLLADGSVRVHWRQEGPLPYTKEGAGIGRLTLK